MKRPNRLIRLLAALSILAGMLAFSAPAAIASPSPGGEEAVWDGESWPPLFGANESDISELYCDDPDLCDGAQEVYFAAVGNGEDFGLGAAQTSVTVQNIDYDDAYIFFYVGNGDGWDTSEYAYLAAGASKTFSADDLGIADGAVVPVVAVAYHIIVAGYETCDEGDYNDDGDCDDNLGGDYSYIVVGDDEDVDCDEFEWQEDAQAFYEDEGSPDDIYELDDDDDGIACEELPSGGEYYTQHDLFLDPAYIAGVAKQAVTGDLLPMTTEADTSVSGYNAVSGREVGFFDQLYFAIVQTNCGPGGCWDSVLRIANVGLDANAAVTVRFFPSDDGSGSLQTGFQLQALVDVGETWSITLSDWVPEGWVGSAHVFSDDAVAAIVDRYKAGTNMWITNTASNAAAENYWQYPTGPAGMPFVLFAPDVRMDYNGWNTGINVANTVDDENNVSVQFFGNNGNAPQTLNQRLEEHGMTYFYEPSDPSEDDCQQPADQAPTCDFVGGAIVLSEYPVAVAVDGVKYYGDDSNVGHAFTYAATGNVYTDQALPLAQKGNPASGMGATSGINFLNPNAVATFVQTWWINPSGFQADNYGPVIVWVPGYATGFVYTMFQHNLPNGFTGSALVTSELPIAATSANVDYQVQGDGTVVYNLYNPCGLFRQSGYPEDDPSCVYEAPVEPPVVNDPGLIVKTVSCPDCEGDYQTVVGATINVTGTTDEGDEYFRSADTNATGTAIFSVPAGVYDVEIVEVPDGYAIDPATAIDADVDVDEGETVNLDNEVLEADATKIIDTAVPGLLVCVFEREYDQGGKPEPIDNPECERGWFPLPKDFVPGQGEVYDRLREPTYTADCDLVMVSQVGEYNGCTEDDFYEDFDYDPEDVECDDFEYLEDAQLFLDDYLENYSEDDGPENYPDGIDDDQDGEVDCDNLDRIPYVRPETNEEIAERLGAVIVVETDENGDATLPLPAGCYYAVITGAGYELVVEEFCLDPGETEINEIDLGEAPGYLEKWFVPPFCESGPPNEGGARDYFDIEGLIEDCDFFLDWENVSMSVTILEGYCAEEIEAGEDDIEGCTSTVFQGGADDLLTGGILGIPYLYITLAPGEYTLCWFAIWEYETPEGTLDYVYVLPNCEEFTITSEETTQIVNYSDDNLGGRIDVLVLGEDDTGLVPLEDILVLLFDQENNLLNWECTDADGEADFDTPLDVGVYGDGNYTVTATDSAGEFGPFPCGNGDVYETQDASKVYSVFEDWDNDGFVNDDESEGFGDPDVIIHLDPAQP